MVVAVLGNIASGKSTLVPELAQALCVEALPERPEDNPWFLRSAVHPGRWAFAAQAWFVTQSAIDSRHAMRFGGVVERTVDEHVEIFASRWRDAGGLAEDELDEIRRLRTLLSPDGAAKPTVHVYLDAPCEVLMDRVRARSRKGEEGLTLETLLDIRTRYATWFERDSPRGLLHIDTSLTDLRNVVNRRKLISEIEKEHHNVSP